MKGMITAKFEALSQHLYGGTCIPIIQIVFTSIRTYTLEFYNSNLNVASH